MSKRLTLPIEKPREILLDESFILCASHQGCDSKDEYCQEELEERQLRALTAILSAYLAGVSLVLDETEPSQVATIYREKYRLMSLDVKKILKRWLDGRGGRLRRCKLAKINPKAVKACKMGTLDPLLCRLAIACRGQAPLWTLDSDFWCASEFHPEIKPTCPQAALDSVK
ncbi:hypothetical protein THIOM_004677 [Candidatus Thiomargarita nelsonii]|uniref:PIN domain-containing protein n=1 Tax=Candidatus Thiomargarita nelsonii TaxID=1003181 RepID=A0A176RVD0_9GAMM|nr:hypothetical protein THIOM_004677 [Candidatus Thiomargarita nelsonii]